MDGAKVEGEVKSEWGQRFTICRRNGLRRQ